MLNLLGITPFRQTLCLAIGSCVLLNVAAPSATAHAFTLPIQTAFATEALISTGIPYTEIPFSESTTERVYADMADRAHAVQDGVRSERFGRLSWLIDRTLSFIVGFAVSMDGGIYEKRPHSIVNPFTYSGKRASDESLTDDEKIWLSQQLPQWKTGELDDRARAQLAEDLDLAFNEDPALKSDHQRMVDALREGRVRISLAQPSKNGRSFLPSQNGEPRTTLLPRNAQERDLGTGSLSGIVIVRRDLGKSEPFIDVYLPDDRYQRDYIDCFQLNHPKHRAFVQDVVHELAEGVLGVSHWLAVAKYERAYGVVRRPRTFRRLTYRQMRDITDAIEKRDETHLRRLLLDHSTISLDKAQLDPEAYQTALVNELDLASAVYYAIPQIRWKNTLMHDSDEQSELTIDYQMGGKWTLSEEVGTVFRLLLTHYFRQMHMTPRRFLAFRNCLTQVASNYSMTTANIRYMARSTPLYYHLLGLVMRQRDPTDLPDFVGERPWAQFVGETLRDIQLELFGPLEGDWRTMPASPKDRMFVAATMKFLDVHGGYGGPAGSPTFSILANASDSWIRNIPALVIGLLTLAIPIQEIAHYIRAYGFWRGVGKAARQPMTTFLGRATTPSTPDILVVGPASNLWAGLFLTVLALLGTAMNSPLNTWFWMAAVGNLLWAATEPVVSFVLARGDMYEAFLQGSRHPFVSYGQLLAKAA